MRGEGGNVLRKLTWRILKKNRTRTIVSIIGVVLSAALMTGVFTLIESMYGAMIQAEKDQNGDYHLRVEAHFGNELEETLRSDPRIDAVIPLGIWGTIPRPWEAQEQDAEEGNTIRLLEGTEEYFREMPLEVTEGRLPQNSGELMVSVWMIQDDCPWRIGDTVEISPDPPAEYGEGAASEVARRPEKPKRAYTIVGIFRQTSLAAGQEMMTLRDPSDPAPVQMEYLRLKNPKQAEEVVAGLYGAYGVSYNNTLLSYEGVLEMTPMRAMLYQLGAILILIVMAGSILLIYNSFSISVGERTREFGLLSSIGATPRQIRQMIRWEGVLVYLGGVPVGILCGIAGIWVTLRATGDSLGDLVASGSSVVLRVSWFSVIFAAGMTAVTVALSVSFPARRAARYSEMEAIRQTREIRRTKRRKSKKKYRLAGLPGMLEDRNYERNPRRGRITILSLAVSLILFVSASSLTSYLTQSLEIRRNLAGRSNIICSVDNRENSSGWREYQALYPGFLEQPQVAEGSWSLDRAMYETDDDDDTVFSYTVNGKKRKYVLMLHILDDETFGRLAEESGFTRKDADEGLMLVQNRVPRYNEQGKAEYLELLDRGEFPLSVHLQYGAQEKELLVAGANQGEYTGMYGDEQDLLLLCSEKGAETLYGGADAFWDGSFLKLPKERPAGFSMQFSARQVPETLERFKSTLKENGLNTSSVYDRDDARRIQNQITAVRVFSYGFLVLVFLISMTNVFHTISTNLTLRRREFAMLRSVGMDDCQFAQMLFLECLRYTSRAALWAFPVSAGIVQVICLTVVRVFQAEPVFPWGAFFLCFAALTGLTAAGTVYAVRRTGKEVLTELLREESV